MSEPNPVPMLVRDPRLYPYHAFEGYAHEGVPRRWKVVHLENDLIEVFVLPEIGGETIAFGGGLQFVDCLSEVHLACLP